MAISSTFDGDFLLETKHETPNKGFHVKTNIDIFFSWDAIPRIQEDDFYKIIVQNLGGPTYIFSFWGLGSMSRGTLVELCWFGISLPRFGR
jgi:hypothetical protein